MHSDSSTPLCIVKRFEICLDFVLALPSGFADCAAAVRTRQQTKSTKSSVKNAEGTT